MKKSATLSIYAKELKDILRDRRTVFSAILLPTLITPVMLVGVGAIAYQAVKSAKAKETTVAWIGKSDADGARQLLKERSNVRIVDESADTSLAFEVLRNKGFDAVVVVPDDFQDRLNSVTTEGDSLIPTVHVYEDRTRERSGMTAEMVMRAAETARQRRVETTFANRGLRTELMRPFDIVRSDVADPEKSSRMGLASFLPYILILMVLTGATYPAIDMTAGEKERGTLETLLVAGVSRTDIVLGKFMTVFTVAMITGAIQLLSMAITFGYADRFMPKEMGGLSAVMSLSPSDVPILALTLIPLAAIFSAVLMTVALFAKSYREAQTYVMPVLFIGIFASMTSMMPGEPELYHSFIPITNVSMLLKQALVGRIETLPLVIAMLSNSFIAAIGLFMVLKMFRRESVLFRI